MEKDRERITVGEFINNMAFMVVACTAIYGIILGRYVKNKIKDKRNKESK